MENEPWVIGVDSRGIIKFTEESFKADSEGGRIRWSEIKEFRYRENRFTLCTKTAENNFVYTLSSTSKGTCKFFFLKDFSSDLGRFFDNANLKYGIVTFLNKVNFFLAWPKFRTAPQAAADQLAN